MRLRSIVFSGIAAALLSACSSTTATQVPQSAQLADRSGTPSELLWLQLGASTELPDKFAIEAELARRGETSSGEEYLGRQTATYVGIPAYARSASKAGDRDCASFASSAEAQKFFLSTGGPHADSHGLDRDGDGMACDFGKMLVANAEKRRAASAASLISSPRQTSSSRCFVGPRGGTYTITASGRKNYGGC
ncbi:excalibur calcium-binding domain-containing protein [Ensifer adhaerens]|uniref:excalibur calcium-binding domain-containing protein n=1 Tax=Ensifer adhaerens TaxID=106592 RepID=UPI001CBDA7C4|nr:excalibur calcium-binding domain-containing protein [Ensifer adhaerens]UAX95769.1 excalibur calcium-binding domain-containing protein [Ensifer adhaerens]UAY04890.1 excalibur calcium-binding domain-containing protein [Ensifer adhaerens]UAY10322.1 excalibur calcium-binding domain-containing protein [Ensifer adhaerens]